MSEGVAASSGQLLQCEASWRASGSGGSTGSNVNGAPCCIHPPLLQRPSSAGARPTRSVSLTSGSMRRYSTFGGAKLQGRRACQVSVSGGSQVRQRVDTANKPDPSAPRFPSPPAMAASYEPNRQPPSHPPVVSTHVPRPLPAAQGGNPARPLPCASGQQASMPEAWAGHRSPMRLHHPHKLARVAVCVRLGAPFRVRATAATIASITCCFCSLCCCCCCSMPEECRPLPRRRAPQPSACTGSRVARLGSPTALPTTRSKLQ